MGFSVTFPQVLRMKGARALELPPERIDGRYREHRHAILLAFSLTNEYLAVPEIDVFHAQT